MKKFIYTILILTFAFIAFDSASAVVADDANSRGQMGVEMGRANAASRVEAVIERIEEMDLDINTERLRDVLERIMERRQKDCYQIEEELEFGDSGEEVEALNKALRKEGYYRRHFADNDSSDYGWDTAKALYDYQKDNDLEEDSFKVEMGFELSEEARELLNNKYDCEEMAEDEDVDEDEEDDDEEDEDDDEDDDEEDEEEDDDDDEDNEDE